jgi:hypothetical protein
MSTGEQLPTFRSAVVPSSSWSRSVGRLVNLLCNGMDQAGLIDPGLLDREDEVTRFLLNVGNCSPHDRLELRSNLTLLRSGHVTCTKRTNCHVYS